MEHRLAREMHSSELGITWVLSLECGVKVLKMSVDGGNE